MRLSQWAHVYAEHSVTCGARFIYYSKGTEYACDKYPYMLDYCIARMREAVSWSAQLGQISGRCENRG